MSSNNNSIAYSGQSSASQPQQTSTGDEKTWMKENYGSEYKFLLSYGMSIYEEEDRAEGRAIAKAFMEQDDMDGESEDPQEDHETQHGCEVGYADSVRDADERGSFDDDGCAEESSYSDDETDEDDGECSDTAGHDDGCHDDGCSDDGCYEDGDDYYDDGDYFDDA